MHTPQRQACPRSGLSGRLFFPSARFILYHALPASNLACKGTSVILIVTYLQMICLLYSCLQILSSFVCGFHATCPGINFVFMKHASVYLHGCLPSCTIVNHVIFRSLLLWLLRLRESDWLCPLAFATSSLGAASGPIPWVTRVSAVLISCWISKGAFHL